MAFTQTEDEEIDLTEKVRETINEVTFGGPEQAERLEKLSHKLTLYLIAHRNYLESVPIQDLCKFKVNWGLK